MYKGLALASALVAGVALQAQAAPTVFSGSSGSLAASASFEIVGTNLVVVLSNTATADALVPIDILTGVYFDLGGAPSLTRIKAELGSGSSVFFGTTDPGNVVGGEWAFKSGLSGAPGSASYGISSSGLGLFGPTDNFPGTNRQGPVDVDGLQFGITSAGDNTATGNTPVTGTNALIKNSVVFTLGIGTQALGTISNVRFQYGTSLTEPSYGGTCTSNCNGGPGPSDDVPAPATLALLGAGLVAINLIRRRHRR